MDYKKLNNYSGWIVFLIATCTYIATLEPTTSLWDCGEYITTAYKLEVGHPPGAPLFMMLGRLFTVFVGPDSAAYMVNLMSALSSSFTILFLFWSITMIGKKITLSDDGNLFSNSLSSLEAAVDKSLVKAILTKGQMIAIVGSGAVGALAYTFTDSFWFSAVEGEVYAMSSFFTAIVVWAILKWEAELTDQENEPDNVELQAQNANRWLIFIFFMIGLSIGVHLLNLLCIPAIAYIIYFKKYKAEIGGFIITGLIGIGTLGLIQAVFIPKTIQLAGFFERFFTNNLGTSFNIGAIFFFVLITTLITGLILVSKKSGNYILNTVTWSASMILIGYSCFAMIVIRSNANTPLDENDPENLVSLESYLKREQYGDWPILYGQYFNADVIRDKITGNPDQEKWNDRSDVYLKRFVVQKNNGNKDLEGFIKEEDAKAYQAIHGGDIVQKYYKTFDGEGQKRAYEPESCGLFPRMYSSEDRHVKGYQNWSSYSPGKRMNELRTTSKFKNANKEEKDKLLKKAAYPSLGENFSYFAQYQVNWMYWRYFMWNFSGRQSDEQGHGNARDGNWISGLNFIDKHHIGDQTQLPSIIADNPSHNKFYLLPFILGIIGFIFTLMKGSKSWWFIMLLFILTGFAVIFYLNQKPMEPRERDYAYAASFYTFAIWIGLSVLGLYDAFKNMQWKDLGVITAVLMGLTFIFFIPVLRDGSAGTGMAMLYVTFVIVAAFGLMIAIRQGVKDEAQSAIIATLLCLPVPILMGVQGWDDHDRSNRYSAQALAENYLNSCSDGSIVYTNGDNDTFPLWYLQEVEGKKTSVRVCNLSLLNTDWYTGQMKNRAYGSAPLPISFEEYEYRQNGSFDYLQVYGTNVLTMRSVALSPKDKVLLKAKIKYNPELFKTSFKTAAEQLYTILTNSALAQSQPDLVEKVNGFDQKGTYFNFRSFILNLMEKGEDLNIQPEEMQQINNVLVTFNDAFDYLPADYVMDYLQNPANEFNMNGNKFYAFPTKGLIVNVDKAKVTELATNDIEGDEVIAKEDLGRMVDQLRWKLPKNVLYKADLIILDIMAHFNWERNIYFASSAATSTYLGLQKYFHAEGLVYKVVPIEISKNSNPNSLGEINKDVMFKNLTEDFNWGNMEKEGVLVDYYTRRTTNNYRVQFSVLADAYIESIEKNNQKLNFLNQVMMQEGGTPEDSIQTPIGLFIRGEIPKEIEIANKENEESKLKVVQVIDKALEIMPNNKVPFGRIMPSYISAYYAVGEVEKGDALATQTLDLYAEELDYYLSIDTKFSGGMLQDMFGIYYSVFQVYQRTGGNGASEVIATRSGEMVFEYMTEIDNLKFPIEYRQAYDQKFGGFFKQIQSMMGGQM